MKKLYGVILASVLNTGCNMEPMDCHLKGGETTAHSYQELINECQANRKLVYKCIIVPSGMDDPSVSTFNCSSTSLNEDAKTLIDVDYAQCNGSTNPNQVEAVCANR